MNIRIQFPNNRRTFAFPYQDLNKIVIRRFHTYASTHANGTHCSAASYGVPIMILADAFHRIFCSTWDEKLIKKIRWRFVGDGKASKDFSAIIENGAEKFIK